MAALVLILAGMNSADALAAIGQARGLTVPDTDVQRAWLRTFEQGYHLP
jgi:hypothetical protein